MVYNTYNGEIINDLISSLKLDTINLSILSLYIGCTHYIHISYITTLARGIVTRIGSLALVEDVVDDLAELILDVLLGFAGVNLSRGIE